jgi:GAF domain-containing protein
MKTMTAVEPAAEDIAPDERPAADRADALAACRRELAALQAELAEKDARWSALYETAIMFAQRVYSGDILTQIVRYSMELLDADDAVLLELDPAAGELTARVSLARAGPPPVRAGTRVKPGEGLTGLALQTGELQIVDAYRRWPGRHPQVRSEGMQAALAAPLVGRRGIVGAGGGATEAPERRFSDQDIQTLTLFAQQAAAVLEAGARPRGGGGRGGGGF